VEDRAFEIAVALAGGVYFLIRLSKHAGLTWSSLRESGWEAIAVTVWAICALVVWHGIRAAIVVSREIRTETSNAPKYLAVVSGSGERLPVAPVHYSHPDLKLWAMFLCLLIIASFASYLTWEKTTTYEAQRSAPPKQLIGSANTRYVKINTRRLVKGQNLQITVHAQISGQVHDFFLSPNIAVLQFNHVPIAEKEDIDADAAIRKNQSAIRSTLQTTLRPPPDILTPNIDAFQTATYPNLAQLEVKGFVTGQTRIYLLTFMIWKDDNNTDGRYDSCAWLQPMPSVDIGLQPAVWHQCR
jgi:hypothetical protein